jgi:hypothetical protein
VRAKGASSNGPIARGSLSAERIADDVKRTKNTPYAASLLDESQAAHLAALGDYQLRRVSSVEVEDWLKSLLLASGTKAKLRNLMSAVFRHAIRYRWLGQHENPIAMVRVSAKRKRIPETLTAEEFRAMHWRNFRIGSGRSVSSVQAPGCA